MFVTNWISPTKIQKISEITNFFRHYFLSRTEVNIGKLTQTSKLFEYFFLLKVINIINNAMNTKVKL